MRVLYEHLKCVHVGMHVQLQAHMRACMLASMSNRRVLAVAMQKGGVGKTTTTINLAYEFATLAQSVLLVDLDQQAHATRGLGITVSGDDASMYEVLHVDRSERVPLREVIKKSAFGFDVAPATLALRSLDGGLGPGGQARLARQLEQIEGYDIVLIDCPPALNELTIAALAAADDVIAAVAPGDFELDAMRKLGNAVLDVQESLNPRVDIRHVLITRYDGRNTLDRDVRQKLCTDWPAEFLGEIRLRVRVGEAIARQVPVAVHDPQGDATNDYRRVARIIAERMQVDAK